ncbi:MAG TPA: hypothetical protein VED63_05590 [Acidimicrobiales bacterium]|nr:hypothetical protein [Acidimicrobiales bacterium]
MIPALIPSAGELLGAAFVVVAALCATTVLAAFWLRRRWARLRSVVACRSRALLEKGELWVLACPLPDRSWRSATRARRRLWRSVGAAEQAVNLARSAGAPLGDLEGLARRLHRAAIAVDASLRIAGRDHGPADHGAVFAQVHELEAAAGHIERAAATAQAWITRPETAGLVAEAEREAAAIAAAVAGPGSPFDR